ncbi:hypothetical protein DPMN_021592 [Dreissena polymorpha]|uniref:Uncharacterized protein n=1 Tax=Dreissena polymorpha TaxID=45954 RepID=A0A9D4S9A2_DREPO|nr:hypothetical protein DPMN_021592 [Dreissena polymorpha]
MALDEVRMSVLLEAVQPQMQPRLTHPSPHWGKTICVYHLPQTIQPAKQYEITHDNTYLEGRIHLSVLSPANDSTSEVI